MCIDTNYLDKLRDKRYEHGEESLTEEEKETLANDIKINAASRQKELEKNTEKVNKGARFFFGFILDNQSNPSASRIILSLLFHRNSISLSKPLPKPGPIIAVRIFLSITFFILSIVGSI